MQRFLGGGGSDDRRGGAFAVIRSLAGDRTVLGGELGDSAVDEHRLRSQGQAGRVRPHRHLQALGRGATESEEVVVDADPFQTHYRAPDLGQNLFGVRPRSDERRLLRHRCVVGRHQGLAVHLSARRERERVRHLEDRWHHGGGKQLNQEAAQLGCRRRCGGGRHDMRDKDGVCPAVGSDHHRVLGHRGVFRQRGLHLARLDPEAVDLDLEVDAPQVVDVAVGQIPGQIAGAVEPLAGLRGIAAERIGDKDGGRQIRPVEVAAPEPHTADEQLAGHTHRHWLQMRVQNVGANVGDRSPDRHQRAGFATLAMESGDVDRGLGGPVEVVELGVQRGQEVVTQVERAAPRRCRTPGAARCSAATPGSARKRRNIDGTKCIVVTHFSTMVRIR